jgi:hypothetical protein
MFAKCPFNGLYLYSLFDGDGDLVILLERAAERDPTDGVDLEAGSVTNAGIRYYHQRVKTMMRWLERIDGEVRAVPGDDMGGENRN